MRGTTTALVALCCLTVLTACDSSSASGWPPFSGSTLGLALSRIAATDETRASLSFDDTAALTRIAGAYDDLRGSGARILANYPAEITRRPGIALTNADYTVTAGLAHMVGLIAGGQNAATVTHGLSDLGWRPDQGHLTAPSLDSMGDDPLAPLVLPLAQVRPDGRDLVYGNAEANLDEVGRPSGPTLAGDPRTSALADCLRDVVAAAVDTPHMSGKLHPTAAAVGVRTPARNTDTPHVVVCMSWASADEAARYHTLLDKALRESSSMATMKPWTDVLAGVTTTGLGGDQHVVSWEADTPRTRPTGILDMFGALDLPAFPCTDRMTPEMKSHFPGYC